MNAIEKRIEWTTQNGKPACVVVAFRSSKSVNADGDCCDVACCELRIAAEVDEDDFVLDGHELLSANSDERIAIPAAQLAEIEAIVAEIHATPEWQAKEAAKVGTAKANEKYEAHRAMMRNAIGY